MITEEGLIELRNKILQQIRTGLIIKEKNAMKIITFPDFDYSEIVVNKKNEIICRLIKDGYVLTVIFKKKKEELKVVEYSYDIVPIEE
ncbi:MAG: hypothetical protein ACO2OV_00035 [Thermoproteota archaeon]|jgi:hypothetical protein